MCLRVQTCSYFCLKVDVQKTCVHGMVLFFLMLMLVNLYKGRVGWKNSSAVIIVYDTLELLVHWDSYENITARGTVATHTHARHYILFGSK